MSFADRDGFIWMDGKLIDWRDAQTHFLTSSLHDCMSMVVMGFSLLWPLELTADIAVKAVMTRP